MSASAAKPLPMVGRWDHRRYGTPEDPIHKSDLLTGSNCLRRFRFIKQDEAGAQRDVRVFGRMIMGTATHGALRRALPWVLEQGHAPDPTHVRKAYFQCWEEALQEEGVTEADLHWAKSTRKIQTEHRYKVAELVHFLGAASERIARVLAVEAKFTAKIICNGDEFWTTGTVDIIFESVDGGLAFADYKSGNWRPSQFRLNHGYEMGIYSHAVQHGIWEGDFKGGRFPDEIYLVLTGDFVPQQKDSRRKVWLRDECRYFHVAPGSYVQVKKGQRKGVGWYRARRTEADLPGLAQAVRQLVGCVRLGRFPPILNDECNRCAYRDACVAENFGPAAADRRRLEAALDDLPQIAAHEDFDA